MPFALALAALTALVLGVARPEATISVPKEEATIVLALDTSRSMAADDVLPSRLEAAQEAARGFLEHVPEKYRVAIVSFSTEAQIVLQPSVDREAAALALGELRLGSGTAIGDAIVRSLETVRPALAAAEPGGPPPAPSPDDVPATVLLLSDGAQTSGQAEPAQAAALAQRLGVPVNTVALGTAAAVVEVPLAGGLRQRVMVEPDPATLARASQSRRAGASTRRPTPTACRRCTRELGSRLGSKKEKRELTQVFAAAGGILLLAGSALSMAVVQEAAVRRLALLARSFGAVVGGRLGCRGGAAPRTSAAGSQVCLPVSGPWVVIPARTGAAAGARRVRAALPAAGVHRRRAQTPGWPTRTSTSSSAARRAARSGPGVTTSRAVALRRRLRGRAARADDFRPFIGCVPTSGGGGRALTGASGSAVAARRCGRPVP